MKRIGLLATLAVMVSITALPATAAESDLDPSFGAGGVTISDFGYEFEWVRSFDVQIDGKVLLLVNPEDEAFVSVVRYTADGELDPSFGGDGRVDLDGPAALSAPAGVEVAGSLSVRDDGSVVVATGVWTGSEYEMVVAQLDPFGVIDADFGDGGRTIVTPGSLLPGDSLVLSDGRLLVVGTDFDGATNSDGFVARFLADGTPDATFGGDGLITVDRGSTEEFGAVAVDGEGRILVTGYFAADTGIAALRFASNGTLDSAFGTGGVALLDPGVFNSDSDIGVDSNDRPVVVGSVGNPDTDLSLVRFTAMGSPDSTFAGDGHLVVDTGGSDTLAGLAVLDDGSILAVGRSGSGDVLLTRVLAGGTLDPAFSDDGWTTASAGASSTYNPAGLVLDRNGAAVVAGLASTGDGDAFVMRFQPPDFPVADTFTDDDGSVHEADIEILARHGIARGCGTGLFCPRNPVTRGQMAAFLTRALFLQTPAGTAAFTDDDASVFQTDIEALAAAGITTGCGDGLFCPENPVTREQMASFLVRALNLK